MNKSLFGRALGRLQKTLRLKSNTEEEVQNAESEPDRALVISVTAPERIPRYNQLRNASRILSSTERKIAVAALLVFFVSLIATGFALAGSHMKSTPLSGGTLTEALVGQPKYLNPIDSVANDVDRDLVKLVYSGLFKYQGLDTVPDIAKEFSWSDDRKTLTVVLKDNVQFHDGMALSSADVVFTFDMIQDPAHKSPLLPIYRNIKISAPDQTTLTFQTDKPDPDLLSKLTVGIMPSHLWQDLTSDSMRLSDLNLKPIGSGPYRIKAFTRDNLGSIHSYTLEKFDKYYGAKPYIKTISFQFYPDRKSASEAYKAGLADSLAFGSAEDAAKLSGTQNKQDVNLDLPNETVAFFNTKRKPLQTKEVRTALRLAVDRGTLVENQKVTAQAVATPFPFLTEPQPAAPDLEQARKILNDAGWVLPAEGNVRFFQAKKAEPAKATTTKKTTTTTTATTTVATTTTAGATQLALTIVVPDEPELIAIAEGLKRQWSLLGVRVDVAPLSMEEVMRKATRERTADVVLLNVYLGQNQDLFPFWWSGQAGDRGLNISGLADRNVDDALEKLRNATTTEAIPNLQKNLAQSILATDPAVFIARPIQHYLVHSRIKGVSPRAIIAEPADRFNDLPNWYIKTWWNWK